MWIQLPNFGMLKINSSLNLATNQAFTNHYHGLDNHEFGYRIYQLDP